MPLDSFFTIGKSHKICQDYIIHDQNPIPHVILGDGCSSSPFTDVGARIVVHAASIALKTLKDVLLENLTEAFPEILKFYTQIKLEQVQTDLGFTSQNLDSTLVILYQVQGTNTVNLLMMGDGVIITKMKGKRPHIVKVSYQKEMPYYLSYALDKKRNGAYDLVAKEIQKDGCIKVVTNGNESTFLPYYDMTFINYDLNDYEYIMIASDGLDSFYRQETGEKVPIEFFITKLTQFKSFKGEFLQRRMKRFLKELTKEKIYHYDDLSIGIIYNDNIT